MTNEQAIIISRVSTDEQEAKDQLPDCRKFCVERGWEIAKEFTEVQSAWKTYVPRKKLDEALEYARKHKLIHPTLPQQNCSYPSWPGWHNGNGKGCQSGSRQGFETQRMWVSVGRTRSPEGSRATI